MKNYINKIVLSLFFVLISGGIQVIFGQETLNKEGNTVTTNTTSSNEDGIEYECAPCTISFSKYTSIERLNPIPNAISIKLPSKGRFLLGSRYADADAIRYRGSGCPEGIELKTKIPIECINNGGHETKFTINQGSSKASFSADDSQVNSTTRGSNRIAGYRPYTEQYGSDFGIYQSDNAELFTLDSWNSSEISVISIIKDRSTPENPQNFRLSNSSTCKDSDVTFNEWVITKDENIPTALKLELGMATDDSWEKMEDYPNNAVDFVYLAAVSCTGGGAVNFQGHVVTEFFTSAELLFELSDLREIWKDQNNIMTKNEAASLIFPEGLTPENASFAIGATQVNRIKDTHGLKVGIANNILVEQVFIDGSPMNDKIGYDLNQEYRTADENQTLLGKAVIKRVFKQFPVGPPNWYLKKTHTDGICVP